MAADRHRTSPGASPGPALRVLGFEAFDGGSHRAVRESISRHSRHRWTWFTLPPRGWKWRMRLGALELAEQAVAAGALRDGVDVIFATSLLSLPDLMSALPPSRRATPAVLYMHENQIAYPRRPGDVDTAGRDVHFALTNLSSVRCADATIWNSRWNHRSFLDGLDELLRHAPDRRARDLLTRLRADPIVIWPPVERPPDLAHSTSEARIGRGAMPRPTGVLHNPVRVVWPHRWEHDKGPEELLEVASRHTRTLDLRWTILGGRGREAPPALREFRRRFADRIDAFGYEPDRAAYWRQLARADWVLSTARHEFFGIAVVEALLAGCLPWLPERLSYPEILPAEARGLHPASPPDDPVAIRTAIEGHLSPVRADRAVARLDAVIEAIVRRGR